MVKRLLKSFRSILLISPKTLYEKEKKITNEPFYFSGTNGEGVLLIQGWSSTPYEFRRLGNYLNEAGYTVYAPLLKGHGTKPSDLKKASWEDWLSDVEIGYQKLKENCSEIHVGGTSIGANLSILFAAKEKNISSLILMATPYKLNWEKTIGFLSFFLRFFYFRKIYFPSLGSSKTITRRVSYRTFPVSNIFEVLRVVKNSRKKLEKIKQPCFILQSRSDKVIDKKSMEIIFEKISSKIKRKKYIEKNYHTFVSDIENENVFEDILNFIKSNENRNIY